MKLTHTRKIPIFAVLP